MLRVDQHNLKQHIWRGKDRPVRDNFMAISSIQFNIGLLRHGRTQAQQFAQIKIQYNTIKYNSVKMLFPVK